MSNLHSKTIWSGQIRGKKRQRKAKWWRDSLHTIFWVFSWQLRLVIEFSFGIICSMQVKHTIYLALSGHIQGSRVHRPSIDHTVFSIDHDYLRRSRLRAPSSNYTRTFRDDKLGAYLPTLSPLIYPTISSNGLIQLQSIIQALHQICAAHLKRTWLMKKENTADDSIKQHWKWGCVLLR